MLPSIRYSLIFFSQFHKEAEMKKVFLMIIIIFSITGTVHAIQCEENPVSNTSQNLRNMQYCAAMYFGMARAAHLHFNALFAQLEKDPDNTALIRLILQVMEDKSFYAQQAMLFGHEVANIRVAMKKKGKKG